MKKLISILIISVICFTLISCDTTDKNDGAANDGVQDTVAMLYNSRYSSADELLKDINEKFDEKFYSEMQQEYGKDQAEAFKECIDLMKAKGIPFPYYEGQKMTMSNIEGQSCMTLYARDMYNITWLYYTPEAVSGEYCNIMVSPLSADVLEKYNGTSVSDLAKVLCPELADPSKNESIESATEEMMNIGGKERPVVTYRFNTADKPKQIFVYDDILVGVCGNTEIFNAEWMSELSFDKIPVSG